MQKKEKKPQKESNIPQKNGVSSLRLDMWVQNSGFSQECCHVTSDVCMLASHDFEKCLTTLSIWS